MTRILCVSDIHIPTRRKDFPYDQIVKKIKNISIDYVFGLGDYVSIDGLNKLYLFEKKVYAVSGNMDDEIVKYEINTKINLEIEGLRIGLIHGWGPPWDLRDRIRKEFDNVDLICFGHTHEKFFKEENGIYFFNPGAICGDKHGENKSFGILTINDRDIKADFINLE
ncbi:MAG TPA: metallophosphoesterase [Spirochaetota bacterium]|nr:metallophosphoesterase [Spirochaetota bacterium]HOL56017.1 metallophosphoesterase [Spirochaetota bacterium]HPP03459.1 metallophosphoesterase [Spirochaetota bacterium]